MTEPDWRLKAACRGQGDFLPSQGRGRSEQVADAIKICGGCPVLQQCAAFAVQIDAFVGVWAGQDLGDSPKPTERKTAARKQLRVIAKGAA